MTTDKGPAISIIVPCYNTGHLIHKMIKSVFGQSMQDFELIMIDDGSTDETGKVLDDLKELHPDKVVVIHKENGGQATARNIALDIAKGEYIVFWDSDDYTDVDYLETLYNAAVNNDSEMVLSGSHEVDEYGNIIQNLNYPVHLFPDYAGRRLSPHGKMYKKEFLERHHLRFADGKLYEDNPFNFIGLFLCRNQVILPYGGYYQVIHTGSSMATMMKSEKIPYEKMEEALYYVNEHKDEVNNWNVYEYTILSFFTYFIFLGNRNHIRTAHKVSKGYKNRSTIIKELCDYVQRIIPQYLPEYYKNPLIGICKGKPLCFEQRAGVWLASKLIRTHLLKAFALVYYLFV